MSEYHPNMGNSSDTIEPSHLMPREIKDPTEPIGKVTRLALVVITISRITGIVTLRI